MTTRIALFTSAFVLVHSSFGQGQTTLADFIRKTPENGRFVVDAEHLTTTKSNPDLATFGRKEVVVGGIKAIVPRQMVVIDDSLGEAPNLYDGLPRAAKILYLLSTLTKEQVRLAAGSGIGMGDVRGEQTAVFRSILPDSITWGTYQVDKDGFPRLQGDETTVAGPQVSQVKLRLSRQTMLAPTHVFPDGRTSFSYMDQAREQVPGQVIHMSQGERPPDGDDRLYGVLVRRLMPNESKKSDLDYSLPRLGAQLSIPQTAPISDLLSKISRTTGVQIVADYRVQGLSVHFEGTKAKASDLLKALALSTTGTYRRVGGTFLLTSDVEGQGTKQLRLALGASSVGSEAERRSRLWRTGIGSSGTLKAISFSPDDPTGPNDAMKARLQEEDGLTNHRPLPLSDLSPYAQQALKERDKFNTESGSGSIDQAGVTSRIVYSFVLPDGTALEPQHDELGRADQFFEHASEPPTLRAVDRPLRTARGIATKSIILRAQDIPSVMQAIDGVAYFGFGTVWLETSDPKILSAAIARGKEVNVHVGLVVRPWEVWGTIGTDEEDQTLLGQPPSSNLKSHLVPTTAIQSQKLSALATQPGLTGILVLGTLPQGYEATERMYGYPLSQASLEAEGEYGYGVSLRLAFLRANGMDPVDIGREGLGMPVNLRLPFFDDPAFANSISGIARGAGWSEKWRAFRADGNRRASEVFFKSFPAGSAPINVEPRITFTHLRFRSSVGDLVWAVPWQPGEPMPETTDTSLASRGPAESIGVSAFTPLTSASDDAVGRQLMVVFRNAAPIALDLSIMSPQDAVAFLGRWIKKPAPH